MSERKMSENWKLGVTLLVGLLGTFCGCGGYATENLFLCIISIPLLLLSIGLSTKIKVEELK